MLVAYGILVSDPVPIGLWILTVLGLGLGLGLGTLDLGLGLDNREASFSFVGKTLIPAADC